MHHKEFYERMKMPFTVCKYLHLVPEIFKFEKCVKYANEMTDDVIHSTQYYIKYTAILRKVVGKSARDNPERYCG